MKRKLSDREVTRAMALAEAAGRPGDAVNFLVSPVLAKYFADVVSTQFLFELKHAVDQREPIADVTPAVPDAKDRAVIESASCAYRSMPLRRSWAALIGTILLLLLLLLLVPQFGVGIFVLAPISGIIAFTVGQDSGRKAFLQSAEYSRAVAIAQAALANESRSAAYWKQLH